MIEFKGRISGKAEKYHWAAGSKIVTRIACISVFLLFPFFIFLTARTKTIAPLIAYPFLFLLVALATRVPKSKKEKELLLPRRVYIEGEYIHSESNLSRTTRLLEEARGVYDYGDFYAFDFPRDINCEFICQKDLLSSGTLEEFEALIGDKLIRKT